MTRKFSPWTAAGPVAGAALGWIAVLAGVPTWFLVGVFAGAASAVVVQRIQLAWFAANISASDGVDWLDRVPVSLGAIRRPLRAVERQLSRGSEALQDAAARERLRDVTLDALELEVDTLDRALGDSREDMAEVLAAIDRALSSAAPQAVLRRELVELRELVRLSVYAELPCDVVPLGEVVAGVVAGGVPRGRVQVGGSLPSLAAPAPLVEALIRAVLGHALSVGEHVVAVTGSIDGALAVVDVEAPERPEPTIHLSMARRAAAILGGDLIQGPERMILAVPLRFVPGVRAISPPVAPWDLPEAM
ncbi:MAG: hypothetical protein OEW30_18040 [Acidimicrobiia bacterium]|nr:hypothetical protein [Acidimicrobiia bacterium]